MAAKLDRGASGTQHVRWGQAIADTMQAHVDIAREGGDLHRLTPEQLAALAAELQIVDTALIALREVVTPYRAFIETAFGKVRARQRVADFLCDTAQTEAEGQLAKNPDLGRFVTGGIKAIREGLALSQVVRAGRAVTVRLTVGAAALVKALPASVFSGAPALADRLTGAGRLLERYLDEELKEIEPKRKPLRAAMTVAIGNFRETLEQSDGRLRSHFSAAFIDSLYPRLAERGRVVADSGPEEDEDAPGDAPTDGNTVTG